MMTWPWAFVNPPEAELARRRQLLDSYGQFAQLSVLLLPLLYQVAYGLSLIFRTFAGKGHRYVQIKDDTSPVKLLNQRGYISWARVRWWLDEEITPGYGTRGQCLLALSWTVWLLLLITKDTGNDYLHLTKRFGIVAASQLPLHYLLAAKSFSPVQYLTRMGHEELNAYHRLLGRIIVFLMACHASLYLNFYVQKGLLGRRIKDRDVIMGVLAISSASLLFNTALARVRRSNYRLFFYLHVILSALLLPVLYFHVSYIRIYILETAAIYGGIVIQRNLMQTPVKAVIEQVPSTNLLSITIPTIQAIKNSSFKAGQHIYISFPEISQKLRLNPFSVANLPQQEDQIRLFIRPLGGTTAILRNLSRKSQPSALLLEGPYGSATYFPRHLASYDRILFIAGGVGATFTLPIYMQILDDLDEASPGRVQFIWSVKHSTEAQWGLDMLSARTKTNTSPINLYVTSSTSSENHKDKHLNTNKDNSDDETDETYELQPLNPPSTSSPSSSSSENLTPLNDAKVQTHSGRPKLHAIVAASFTGESVPERIAIFVCGPGGLGTAVRKEISPWVGRGTEVWFHEEKFGW